MIDTLGGASPVAPVAGASPRSEPGETHWFDIGGTSLAIRVPTELDALAARGWLYADFRTDSPGHPADLQVEVAAQPGSSPASWVVRVDDPGSRLDAQVKERCLWGSYTWLPDGHSGCWTSVAEEWKLHSVLETMGVAATVCSLVGGGFTLVHGAALCRAGAGLLLAGNGGAGKTTLAVGLAAAGWTILGEDLCTVDELGRVMSYPLKINLRRGGFDLLQSLFPAIFASYRQAFAKYERVPISASDLFPAARPASCPVRWVVILEGHRAAEEPQISRLSPGAAAARLLPHLRPPKLDMVNGIEWSSRIVGGAECFSLRAGGLGETLLELGRRLRT